MLEPKSFYKKLNVVLSKIFREKPGTDFLLVILEELEKIFGEAIHLTNGRIYEMQDGKFIRMNPGLEDENLSLPQVIPKDSAAVAHVLHYGTYIYDNPGLSIDPGVSKQHEYAIPAAFAVNDKERQWIFIYELKSGWIREEIEFCLNAVREALNYRFFSESIKYDLQQAANIQQSLLPQRPPELRNFQIAFRSVAAEMVVGDLYDFYKFDDELFGVCVGDASGHGFPAALLVRDVVTGMRMGLEKEMKMVYTVKKLNRVIHRSNYSTRYISLFYCEIDNDGNLIYVNAGHPPPILVSGTNIIQLYATGVAIGFLPEIKLYRVCSHMLPGDVLLLYSDGLIERQDLKGEHFGLQRLQELISKNKYKSVQEIVEMIFATVYAFGADAKWTDDATAVIIKRKDNSGLLIK